MKFYSPKRGGFYCPGIHTPEQIPDDALELTDKEHIALLEGQSKGQEIKPGPDGYPVLVDRVVSEDDVRTRRNAELASSDWVAMRAGETGKPVPAEWVAYRQALRDVTEQPGFPASVEWPEKPT